MALTCGFFDSLNYDRRYNSEQISAIFDNILTDGIIASQGDHFAITVGNTGMQIMVGTGRAWFDHTWTKNDSIMVLTVPDADATRQRRDIVVLEVNHEPSIRANSIKIVQGNPTSAGTLPNLVNTTTIHQYPLAYITVPAGASSISASNIENRVGLSPTSFSTGILQNTPLDSLWAQWKGQFEDWFEGIKLILTDDVVANLTAQLSGKVNISDKATTSEATAGTNNTHWMTPALVKAAIDPLRNTVYIQNLNRRVYVNAMLNDIASSLYTLTLSSSNSMYLSGLVITNNYIYYYGFTSISQGSSSTSNINISLYSYRVTRPINSSKTFTSVSSQIDAYSRSHMSYDSTEYGFPNLTVIGSKALNVNFLNFHGYNPSTSPKSYWRMACDLSTGRLFSVDQSHNTAYSRGLYGFATDNYNGTIALTWGTSSNVSQTLRVRYNSNSSSSTYKELTTTISSNNTLNKYLNAIGGYGDTLYYIQVTNPNGSDITFMVHSVTFSSSSMSLEDAIANVNIKNATTWSLLYYDDSNAYIMVGGYSIPLIFSFVNKRFTNAEVVSASSTSSAIACTGNNIQYLGYQENLHYFRNPSTGTVFTLAYSPTTTGAFVIRSNITLASFTGCTTYKKPYSNAWRPQHFVIYGSDPVILDWQGHSFTPALGWTSGNGRSYLMPNAISTDTIFGIKGSSTTFTPVGPDAEFTLVTDGKAAT